MDKTELFIEKAKRCQLKNTYDYSKVNYINAKINVIIICPYHGEFNQTPNKHLNGYGCKKCSNENTSKRLKILWEDYMKELLNIHNNKYDYSKVIWNGVDNKIVIVCPKHGDFEMRPACHKKGRGCQKCSKENKIQYNKLSTDEFINKSIISHGNIYDYSKTKYEGADKYLTIICKKHGEFNQIPSNHYKYGCRKCSNENNYRNKELNKLCKENFIKKSNIIHNNNYDYSKSLYVNVITKLIIICPIHGEFYMTPNNHLTGRGCALCGILRAANTKVKTYDEYYKSFIEVHSNTYNYDKVVWINASTKIDVICNKHGPFKILPLLHKNGSGCPSCNNQYSKKSIDWLRYISFKFNINIQHAENIGEKYIYNKTKVDGYCKENNTIYEFHGDFWHGNPKIYEPEKVNPKNNIKFGTLFKKTLHKELNCRNLGFNYICIWEYEWDRFISIIKKIQKNYRLNRLL